MAGMAKQTYSGLQPLSTADLAAVLGISTAYVSQLVRRGVLKRDKDGHFDLVSNISRYIKDREEGLKSRWAADAAGRSRLTDARAAMVELKLQQQRGELLPADQVAAAYGVLVVRSRNRLLALPRKIAPRLTEARTAAQAEAIVRREIESALNELSRLPALGEPEDKSDDTDNLTAGYSRIRGT